MGLKNSFFLKKNHCAPQHLDVHSLLLVSERNQSAERKKRTHTNRVETIMYSSNESNGNHEEKNWIPISYHPLKLD